MRMNGIYLVYENAMDIVVKLELEIVSPPPVKNKFSQTCKYLTFISWILIYKNPDISIWDKLQQDQKDKLSA